jgi:hypothetical protein
MSELRPGWTACDIMQKLVKPMRNSTMPTTKRTLDELAGLGKDIFDKQVRPGLRPEDDGKFVAIDVETGDYEIDEDDYAAVMRLRSRKPLAEMWLMRAGFPTTCRIGAVR